MPSSARAEREVPPIASLTPPTLRAQELPTLSPELGDALLGEQAKLRCEVLLWQRWVRYLALGAMVLLSLVLGSNVQSALVPLALLSAAYVGVVISTSWVLRHEPGPFAQAWFP